MDYKNNIHFRKETLKKLLLSIEKNEDEICNALYQDFKKSKFEAILTETNYVISELKSTIKNLNKWAKPKMVLPSFLNFPSTDYIFKEPYGNVLIIAPWNYPFQLSLCPLIAAVAAGNKVTLKPSELTPNTSKIISEIISSVFDINHVEVIEGGIDVSNNLLSKRWDYIFFTGSVSVGKIVTKAAAIHLTPITLELGGKNPCIIDEKVNLQLTAKRIVWGKLINAGQSCIAPDYLLVNHNVKQKLIELLISEIELAYGKNPENSIDFPRIINQKNFSRLVNLIEKEKIIYGGNFNEKELYFSPTLIDEPILDNAIMREEIFGPILPILSYDDDEKIEDIVNNFEKPLALYVFSKRKKFASKIIQKYSFGGGSINDTLIHFANSRLPFGGVGYSGVGSYHGKLSFNTFSHSKSVVKKATWLDVSFRYAPYQKKIKILKKILNWL